MDPDAAADGAAPIAVLVHYADCAEAARLSLRITISPKWFDRDVRSALIGPFVDAYNKKRSHAHKLDAFSLRGRTRDGARIEGNERCGAVLRALAARRGDGAAELFLVGAQFFASSSWRDAEAIRADDAGESDLVRDADAADALVDPRAPHMRAKGVCIAKERYAKPPQPPDAALAAAGARVHDLLQDPSACFEDVRATTRGWIVACADDADAALSCVDDRGRTLLHNAATRGDVQMCAELAAVARGAMVTALDDEHNTPITLAALYGRSLVLAALLEAPAAALVVNEKNRFLMSPLQLACCDDGAGSPEVAELLIRHGADPNAKCWDKTPLMAAAASEHYELVRALCERLGADPMLRNGEQMMAMDYCKTLHTSELLHDFMEGKFVTESAAPSFVHAAPPPDDTSRKDESPRFTWTHHVPLAEAFAALDVDLAVLAAFEATGAGADHVKTKWRKLVLAYHPDKRPSDFDSLPAEEQQRFNTRFHAVQRAYEAIEAHLASLGRSHARPKSTSDV